MSGHNRWTKIKRKKEAMGASKGALFTKLIREVTVAARSGGGDPDHNARLRSAVLAAREANMPADNITRANKNRTAGDVRAIFTKGGGSMAASGAVAFQFDHKGVIPVKKGSSEDEVMELALEAGAEDVLPDGDGGFELRTDTGSLMQVHKA